MWIYQDKAWPNFYWSDQALSSQLAKVRYNQGHLLGKMESLGFTLKSEATLQTLTNDVVKPSAIEGDADLDTQQWEILHSTHTFNAQGYVTQLVLRSV